MKIKISSGNSRMDKRWNLQEMELDEFRDRIATTHRTSETVEQYRKMSKAKQDEIKDVGGFVLGALKDGRRKKDCVLSRSALSLDMDYALPDIIDQIEMFFSFKCYFYSTHKHKVEKPRLRLIIPLAREVFPDEYFAVARKVAEEIGIELFDDTTYEPSRLMYWPSTSSDGEFLFREIDGNLLNPDEVLAKYKDWHNTAEWPVSKRQQTIVQREVKKQADPLTKPGTVGAFCRTYSVPDAIDTFLNDVYKKSAMPGRYDYIPADSQAGVVIYDDTFAYSHHATDSACGKLLNAFDIVRIHKFSSLDDKANKDTEPTKLQSFKAMQEFAISDEHVKIRLAKERESLALDEFDDIDDENWQIILELDKQGKVKDTLTNIANIIRFDPNLKPIVYNEFKSTFDVIGPLHWKQVRPGWGDADLACAKVYFERVYGIWSPPKFKDALLAVVSAERTYQIVVRLYDEYLSGKTVDYIKRIFELEGIKNWNGKANWQATTLQSMLLNEKYKGDAILQKSYTVDFHTKKRVKNDGQIQQFHIEDNHEAIIDPLIWEAVQHEHQRRNKYCEEHGLNAFSRTPEANPFAGKVICGTCNQTFTRRGWKTGDIYRKVWQCQERYRVKGVQGCTNRHVDEAILEQAFMMAWNALVDNRDEIKARWETHAEFGNPLEQYRAVQFADITENTKHITDFEIDFMLKTLDHITVFESGKLVVTFMDGTEIECGGE